MCKHVEDCGICGEGICEGCQMSDNYCNNCDTHFCGSIHLDMHKCGNQE